MIHLEKVLKMSWSIFTGRLKDVLERCLENFLKTSWRRMTKTNIIALVNASWGSLEGVFWIRMTKANIFVWIRMSWKRLEDVFRRRRRRRKTSFIKTTVCWGSNSYLFVNGVKINQFKAKMYIQYIWEIFQTILRLIIWRKLD